MPLPSSLRTKRGRPRKHISIEEKQIHDTEQRRIKRQATQSAKRSEQFNQYYSTTEPASTAVDPSLPTYFPPGELTIPAELEQLLPPPSPQEEPYDLAANEIPPLTDDLLPLSDNLPPLSDDIPPLDDNSPPLISPEVVRIETNQPGRLSTSEDRVQAADPLLPPTIEQPPECPTTDRASLTSDLAQALTDQLYEHHGCCRQCHEQQ